MTTIRVLSSVLGVVLLARATAAQTADNVLLVINDTSPASIQIGDYYASKRGIATDHIVHIKTDAVDTVRRSVYENDIESRIGRWISRHGLQDRVLYIVLTKGVPLRIAGTEGRMGTVASVDSELTVLYQKLVGLEPVVIGQTPNPYYLGQKTLAEATPFTRFVANTYLVTRLDGYSTDDVLKLIDRGSAPVPDGTIVLDQRAARVDAGGDRWLAEAADQLRRVGHQDRVLLEATRAMASTSDSVIGYYSWGSNDPATRVRRYGLKFSNGALAGMFVSTDARSFNEPPAAWIPGGGRPSAGGGTDSLVGDLIRDGVTGVAGHVGEPFFNAIIRPQILFPAYLAGFNLAESFYLSMPFLSWQTVVIGDPLCAPFPRKPLSTDQLSKGIDPATKLPALFAERRLGLLLRYGLKREALELALQAEAEVQGGKTQEEVESLLRRATDLEPRLNSANLGLAEIFQRRGDHDAAIERYQRVIASDPRNVTALNNLAYALAMEKQSPKEALPFAERAYRLSPIPLVADTLGWIHHLLGDNVAAAALIEQAAAGAPNNADVFVHAAFVHAALNDRARATRALDAAEKIAPELSTRADIRGLRERLTLK